MVRDRERLCRIFNYTSDFIDIPQTSYLFFGHIPAPQRAIIQKVILFDFLHDFQRKILQNSSNELNLG
jgi:hypothetical protein